MDQKREQWLAARKLCVTATDIGAICGLSPYKTIFDVWYEKTTPPSGEKKDYNSATDWGNRLEPVIAQAYTDITGNKLRKCEFIFKEIYFVPCGCTPDYETEDGAINVEIKTANAKMEQWGDDGTDEVPDMYLTQVQWQMGITGKKMTHLPCLVFARDLRTFNIAFDQAIFDELLKRAADFWKCVVDKTPPAIDGSNSCRKYLSAAYKANGKALMPNPEQSLVHSAAVFFRVSKALEILKEKKELMTNQILAELGGYQGLKIDGIGKLSVVLGGTAEKIDYKSAFESIKSSVPPEIVESVLRANTATITKSAFIRTYPGQRNKTL
jgi:putative phage-type endonuclease